MNDKKVIIDDDRQLVAEESAEQVSTTYEIPTSENPEDSFEGRKHQPDIDGPMQDSQETDEIYSDPRKHEDLPPGGKNVADLNAYDLSQKGNEI